MTGSEIQTKLDLLRENLQRLDQIPQTSLAEFTADFRNVDSALHRLQTSIQALIDLGSYAVARLALRAPRTSRDILEQLETEGHLPEGSTERFGPVFGFRNRVVHLYDRIDERIVFEILTRERQELRDLLDLLLGILEGDD